MKRLGLTFAFFALLIGSAQAQLGGGLQFPGPGMPAAAGGAYAGPGDIVAGAKGWWGLRAYNSAARGTKIANVCNSTGGTDVGCADMLSDATTGRLVSATISSITCPGANCTVKTLYDQSGALYCAGATACDLTQATVTSRPTLDANCINTTLPCMSATGAQVLASSANITANSSAYTAVFVANRTPTSSATQGIFGMATSATWRFKAAADTVEDYNGSPLLPASATDAAFHSFQGIMNGASSEWFIDNVSTTGTVGATGISAGPINMFADTFGTNLTGKITEVGFWITSLSSTKVGMCNNQRLYWGTPGAC